MALALALPLALAPLAAAVSPPDPAPAPEDVEAAAQVAAIAAQTPEENAPIIVLGMAQAAERDGKKFDEPEEGPDTIANLANPDPLEGMNRVFFAITQPIDRFILRPIAIVYRTVLPEPVRDGVHNALANIFMPSTLANDMIQLKPERAWQTAKRFVLNSTLGFGGLVDVAKRKPFNTPAHSNGFSNTLGVAGAGPGVYLYLPILGPTTIRDLIGMGGDAFTQPLLLDRVSRPQVAVAPNRRPRSFVTEAVAVSTPGAIALGTSGVDTRARAEPELKALKAQSVDFYAALRSTYLQHRAGQIAALKVPPGQTPEVPEFDDPLEDPEAKPAAKP
ncbi:MlaA family lipoprotein [Novosphingobium sediminicola]|uniref:Phospholipid-binding lipoprotein MlaA n=1 Tax=Novosphingobium sediminicola TaxID=563162 RepID=A0A7W6G663_9SPHN|nr:VacJ family lipoprotein [Novosphingobium sediminicola]MBB3955479.1 phospholipid-binding lipoprotein MlaA [Novosphingobium sediminicola]